MKKFLALAVLGAFITACSTPSQKKDIKIIHSTKGASSNYSTQKVIIDTENPELREAMQQGAIKGPNGLYFMPIGRDSGGCRYYTSFAPGKVTLTSVYYRKRNGGFTNSRSEANCPS